MNVGSVTPSPNVNALTEATPSKLTNQISHEFSVPARGREISAWWTQKRFGGEKQ